MTTHEAAEVLKLYQYGVQNEVLPHSFDLNDETVEALLRAIGEAEITTNADRLRAMSDEELAEFLRVGCFGVEGMICRKHPQCELCWLDWLRQPAEGGGEE